MAANGHFEKNMFYQLWQTLSDFDDLGVYFDSFDGGHNNKSNFKAK